MFVVRVGEIGTYVYIFTVMCLGFSGGSVGSSKFRVFKDGVIRFIRIRRFYLLCGFE